MKSNAKIALGLFNIINPLTKMQMIISNVSVLFCDSLKYVKLAKNVMIQVFGLVENE